MIFCQNVKCICVSMSLCLSLHIYSYKHTSCSCRQAWCLALTKAMAIVLLFWKHVLLNDLHFRDSAGKFSISIKHLIKVTAFLKVLINTRKCSELYTLDRLLWRQLNLLFQQYILCVLVFYCHAMFFFRRHDHLNLPFLLIYIDLLIF